MQIKNITEKEYDKLIKRIEFFEATRNNLLTFSFTAVLAALGVAMTLKMDSNSSWGCLIPFFLIIPFAARISYYRLASAHIGSFLRVYAQSDMQFEIGSAIVSENKCKRYNLIAWLVNHEMVLLGVASSCTFYLKYLISVDTWKPWNYIVLTIPLALIAVVYLVSDTTYEYKKLVANFVEDWDGKIL